MAMRKLMGVVVVSMGAVVGGCADDAGVSGTSAALSATELEAEVASGPSEIELQVVDGVAREVHTRPSDHDERLEGFVVAVDAELGTVAIADLGVVSFGAGTRFRTATESHASRAAWLAEAQPGTFIRASRATPSAPQAPDDAAFFATDLRIDHGDRAKLELTIDRDNLLTSPPSLLVLGRSFDLSTLQVSDDGTADQGSGDESGDDHGGEAEPGDDHGGGEAEPGDDHGGGEAEPGDDHGGHGQDD